MAIVVAILLTMALVEAFGPVLGSAIGLVLYALVRGMCWLILRRVGDPNDVYLIERRPIH